MKFVILQFELIVIVFNNNDLLADLGYNERRIFSHLKGRAIKNRGVTHL